MFKNLQIYGFTVVLSMYGWKPQKHKFDWLAILIIFWSAAAGLLISFILKYSDNVCKGFTAAAATVLVGFVVNMVFAKDLDPFFWTSSLIVALSSYLYFSGFNKIIRNSWAPTSSATVRAGVYLANNDAEVQPVLGHISGGQYRQ